MKSIKTISHQPAGIPIVADDVLEFHASRLLLLVKICGTAGKISGLTKMAKLDFFVRYPQFFADLMKSLGKDSTPKMSSVESSMVKFHYGPWDKRYYHILSYLEAKRLLNIYRKEKAFEFQLTDLGRKVATEFEKQDAFKHLIDQMRQVKKELGDKAGSTLKRLIYQVFQDEIAKAPMGEVIKQ